MSDTILTQHHDGWMQITLNRPDRLNAFNDEMHAALTAALKQAEKPRSPRAIADRFRGAGFVRGKILRGAIRAVWAARQIWGIP
jgi:2-(1,2-epoxy-1,2-dihydrophenyl)acetyl-CoA isomerase